MTPAGFRTLALALVDATESAHHGHPDFRLGGKIFATLGYPDETCAMVQLTPEQQQVWLEKAPAAFRPSAGAWGRKGSTLVQLSKVTLAAARTALAQAAENARAKAGPKSHSRPARFGSKR